MQLQIITPSVKDTSAWDVYVGANVNCGLGDPTNFFSTHCLDASTKNRGQYHSDKLEELAVQLNSTFRYNREKPDCH